MGIFKQENKFVSYLLFLLALFILVLFAKNQYTDLQSNLDEHTSYQNTLQTGRDKLAQLNKIKADLKQDSSAYDKYSVVVKENELLDYIYSNVEAMNSQSGVINVKGITLGEGKINEFGFHQMDVDISATVSNDTTLNNFLSFLTNNTKYQFFIDSFSYPTFGREGAFNINIPLKIFYK